MIIILFIISVDHEKTRVVGDSFWFFINKINFWNFLLSVQPFFLYFIFKLRVELLEEELQKLTDSVLEMLHCGFALKLLFTCTNVVFEHHPISVLWCQKHYTHL